MAEQVPEFQRLREIQAHPSKYPWEKWLDGNPWMLYMGEDFQCSAVSIVSSASKWASRRGFSIQSSISEDQMIVSLQAVPKRERKRK